MGLIRKGFAGSHGEPNVPCTGTDLRCERVHSQGIATTPVQRMFRVTYIHPDGQTSEVEAADGANLMTVATAHGIEGIVGDCGGVMSCATCHVIVQAPWDEKLGARSENEDQMLDYTAAPREAASRLCCQIVMNAAIDGICVRIADPQL